MKGYDAVVIGAGSVGVPTTYFLAKEGFKVLCIDRHGSSGQGQNKAAIGGVRATHSDPAKIKLCQESLRIFSTWEERTGFGIEWKKGGYCFPVYRENEERILHSILPIQKKYDLNIDWVDRDKIMDHVPGINPHGLMGGTFSADDGQVSPLRAIAGFTREAKALGADFIYGRDVKDIQVKDDRIAGVRTTDGEYHADVVVNAAGARASEICKMAGRVVPVVPDSHEAGITSPVKPFLNPLVVDLRPGPEGRTANFYFGQVKSGQVIFCYTPIRPFIGEDRGCTSEFMPVIARRMVDLIPRFKNLLIRRLWRGLYPMTPDGIPVVGVSTKIEGFYMGIGMCGQGFMLGPGVGKNLADLIAHGKPLLEREVFELLSPERDFYKEKKELLK